MRARHSANAADFMFLRLDVPSELSAVRRLDCLEALRLTDLSNASPFAGHGDAVGSHKATTRDRPFSAPGGQPVYSKTLSMREYDLIADWYSTDRGRTVSVAEAVALAGALPADACLHDDPGVSTYFLVRRSG
jgi:hypothetical protein